MSHTAALLRKMQKYGLVPQGNDDIIWDGRIHRFPGRDKPKSNRSGWYRAFPDRRGAVFGDYSSLGEDRIHWQADRSSEPTPEDRARWRAADKKRAEQKAREVATATEAVRAVWKNATRHAPIILKHPYLKRKKIESCEGLRISRETDITEITGPKKDGTAHVIGAGLLLVPMRRDGKLVDLQRIWPDGRKRYFPKADPAGCACIMGGNLFNNTKNRRIFICEGWATAWTIRHATNCATLVAFTAHALPRIAKRAKEKYATAEIIVAADNDRWSAKSDIPNPGVHYARMAEEKVEGVRIAIPDFKDLDGKPTDFDDLRIREGMDAVRKWLDPDNAGEARVEPSDPGEQEGKGPEPAASVGDDSPEQLVGTCGPEASQFYYSQLYWDRFPRHMYDPRTGTWWAFEDGHGWHRANAELLMRGIIEEVVESKRTNRKLATVNQSLVLASHRLKTDRDHRWDRKAGVVGLPGGLALELANGTIRPAEREEYLTRQVRCEPVEDCTEWKQVVLGWCGDNPELAEFVQVAVGYSLLGSPREKILFVVHGRSDTGKTEFLERIGYAVKDYAKTVPVSIFTESRGGQPHPTDVASIDGPRFLHCSEVDPDAAWNTARLKAITGNDTLTGRFMRRDFFEFKPQGVLWIALNDVPRLKSVDSAIRRRMRILPLDTIIPEDEQDVGFSEKWKRPERCAQIVRWILDGAVQYKQGGLPACSAVNLHTNRYLDSQDIQARFINEAVEFTDGNDEISRSEMRAAFESFATGEGWRRPSVRNLYRRLREAGADEVKRRGVFHLIGVRFSEDIEAPSGRTTKPTGRPQLLQG